MAYLVSFDETPLYGGLPITTMIGFSLLISAASLGSLVILSANPTPKSCCWLLLPSSKELVKYLPDYEIVSEHIPSRVVMFAKKKCKINGVWRTWIDFPKWHQLVNFGKEFAAEDYSIKTPQAGLSGKGTLDGMPSEVKKRYLKEHPEMHIFVNESARELSFYEE